MDTIFTLIKIILTLIALVIVSEIAKFLFYAILVGIFWVAGKFTGKD